MTNNEKKMIRELVEKNDLEKALQQLVILSGNTEKIDEIILQSSRFNDLKKSIRAGQVSFENQNLEKNKIRNAILDLLNEIDLFENNDLDSNKLVKKLWKTKSFFIAALCIIAIISTYKFINYKSLNEITTNEEEKNQRKLDVVADNIDITGEKNSSNKVEGNQINIQDNAIVSGYVSAGDIIINNHLESIQEKTQELISILELRAKRINQELSKYYKYATITNYLANFDQLHRSHINALRKGNIILAHEILIEIHKLSSDLESSEFWKRHEIECPDCNYNLRDDAFTRGEMICEYIVGEMESYSDKYPSFYSRFEEYFFNDEPNNDSMQIVEIKKIYELILQSKE